MTLHILCYIADGPQTDVSWVVMIVLGKLAHVHALWWVRGEGEFTVVSEVAVDNQDFRISLFIPSNYVFMGFMSTSTIGYSVKKHIFNGNIAFSI